MITRYAVFEGSLRDGAREAFRQAVLDRLVPLWTQFPGNTDVRVTFGEERDEGAPEYPLILAITYPDRDAMAQALESAPRHRSREVTGEIVAAYFDGRIHHHVTEAHAFPA